LLHPWWDSKQHTLQVNKDESVKPDKSEHSQILCEIFLMEPLKGSKDLMRPGDRMGRIDLMEAYFTTSGNKIRKNFGETRAGSYV